jgi:hypothetical protein
VDGYPGELIFLANEGVLGRAGCSSHMRERFIHGSHGYYPADKHNYAIPGTDQLEIPNAVETVPDIFLPVTRDA